MQTCRALLILAVLAASVPADAHSWYPAICCSGSEEGGDCHPVPCDSLNETRNGIEWHGFRFKDDQVRPSQDKDCHVCVGHYESPTGARDVPHCVFIQPST